VIFCLCLPGGKHLLLVFPRWPHLDTTTGAPNPRSVRRARVPVRADLEIGAPAAPVPNRGGL